MVGILRNTRMQSATWWAVTPNGTGGDVFASPVLIQCRWQDRNETFVGHVDRRELVSKAVIFADRAISVGDYLAPGDETAQVDPTLVTAAEKVQRYQKFPDLRSLETLHKVIL